MGRQSVKKRVVTNGEGDGPFWLELEHMLQSAEANGLDEGHLKGSLSGESWKMFLGTVRDEVLERLAAYRREDETHAGFCASSLSNYREERRKIERAYLRDLVTLYKNAERAYKTVSG